MRIKINTDAFPPHKKGDIIEIEDNQGIPLKQFWRRRLRDAYIDGCCEVVKDTVVDKATLTEDEN